MSIVLAATLRWHYDDALDVGYALVNGAHLENAGAREALAVGAHPDDIAHCHRLRRGGVLSLLLRTVTRELAGADLGLDPDQVRRFRAACTGCGGPHGRPEFAGPDGGGRWYLSVSHSSGVGAVAVSTQRVGIDVQRALLAPQARPLDSRLHKNDQRAIHSEGPDAYAGHATRVWVRKEAYGKALGSGLCRKLARDDLTRWPHLDRVTGLDLVAPPSHYAGLAVVH